MTRQFTTPNPNPVIRGNGYGYKPTRFYSMFWNWMAENTAIGSFSTDECVDNSWPVLVEARAQLEKWVAKPPGNNTVEDMQRMLDQLDNVMRRGTRNRIATSCQRPAHEDATKRRIAESDTAKSIDAKPATKDDVDDIIRGFRS